MLPPLQLRPIFKRYLWGGRRLGTALGKPIGEGDDYAESWEVADHEQGQSVVAAGPLAGMTLRELVARHGDELLGRHAPQPRFPLLFKYLDCQRDLSVQVHPDDAAAARLNPPDLGKTEAWVVLDAAPGSRIYAGLVPGVTRDVLAREVAAGRTELCLHSLEPRVGDCIFIPAGTVHALGAGLLVAEIQQASDTTWRLYDWGRVGPDGKPRPLHVEAALNAIDDSIQAVGPQTPQPTDQPHVERLVACDKFVLDRWTMWSAHSASGREPWSARSASGREPWSAHSASGREPWSAHSASGREQIGGDERFHVLSVIDGALRLESPGGVAPTWLSRGQTILLPAGLAAVTLSPQPACVLLDMYLP